MTENKRRIRSFALRTGRMTDGQRNAYDASWPRYGLSLADGKLDLSAVFGRRAPLVFEIGFGMGQSLAEMAINEPDKDFIGVEVHTPGVAKLMMLCEQHQLSNIRIYRADALDVLTQCIPVNAISRLQLFFPDPWHKTKHNKRRIVQPAFIELIDSYMQPQGLIHFATDWQPYAKHMLAVLQQYPHLHNLSPTGDYCERPATRPITKFERRGERLGHGVWDLLFRKQAG